MRLLPSDLPEMVPKERARFAPAQQPSPNSLRTFEQAVSTIKPGKSRFASLHNKSTGLLYSLRDNGEISSKDSERISKDANAELTLTVARQLLPDSRLNELDHFLRKVSVFYDFKMVERGTCGTWGTGMTQLLEHLSANYCKERAARFASDHIKRRLAGVRYHIGMRGILAGWYSSVDRSDRIRFTKRALAERGSATSCRSNLDWMLYSMQKLSVFIEQSDDAELKRRWERMQSEITVERQRYDEDVGFNVADELSRQSELRARIFLTWNEQKRREEDLSTADILELVSQESRKRQVGVRL